MHRLILALSRAIRSRGIPYRVRQASLVCRTYWNETFAETLVLWEHGYGPDWRHFRTDFALSATYVARDSFWVSSLFKIAPRNSVFRPPNQLANSSGAARSSLDC